MRRRHSHPAPYDTQPLVGFGPTGVIATIILLGLITAVAAGIDVRFQILKGITFVFGGNATIWVTGLLSIHSLWMTSIHFGLIGITYLLVAIHIHPRRTNYWLIAAIVIWAIAEPRIISESIRVITMNLAGSFQPSFMMRWLWLVEFAANGITAALLLMATRTWRVGAVVIGLAGLNASMSLYGMFRPAWTEYLGVVGHVVLACALLTWAIRARVRYSTQECHCIHCAYDRTGITPNAPCPECGVAPRID